MFLLLFLKCYLNILVLVFIPWSPQVNPLDLTATRHPEFMVRLVFFIRTVFTELHDVKSITSHDGYDRHGPKAYIYEIIIVYMCNSEYIVDTWCAEYRFWEDQSLKLYSSKIYSKQKFKEYYNTKLKKKDCENDEFMDFRPPAYDLTNLGGGSFKKVCVVEKFQSLAELAVTTAMMTTLATTAAPKFSGVGEGSKEKKTMSVIDKIIKSANNFYNYKVTTEGRGRFPGQLTHDSAVGGYLDEASLQISLDLFKNYESSEGSKWASVFGTKNKNTSMPKGALVSTSEDTNEADVSGMPPAAAKTATSVCENSIACKNAAKAANLKIGGAGYSFEGDYGTKGCYTYSSTEYNNHAYFGTGGNDAQRSKAPKRPKIRIHCTNDDATEAASIGSAFDAAPQAGAEEFLNGFGGNARKSPFQDGHYIYAVLPGGGAGQSSFSPILYVADLESPKNFNKKLQP